MRRLNAWPRWTGWALAACMVCSCPAILHAQETGGSAISEAGRLRNAGQFAEAIVLLKAHLRSYPTDGDAIRMLAQTQYWAKDFAGARETYVRAIRLHPEDSSLRQQYSQFLSETSSQRGWVRFSPSFRHDDQPLDRIDVQATAGWFVEPALSVALNLSGMQFQLSDTASRSVSSAGLELSHSSRESGATFSLAGGVLHRSFDATNEFIGSLDASAKLSPAVRLRGSFAREGYFYTEASLSRTVMTNTGRAVLSVDAKSGFLGQLSAQLQQYADDNALTTAYLWALAPVIKSPGSSLHVGYSGAYQNSSKLRFGLEQPIQSANPGSATYNFAGRYDPYYTPLDLITHSVIAAFAGGVGGPAVFRINAGYAVIGTENAPHFMPVALTGPPRTVVGLTTSSRDTHPWNARATVEFNSSNKSPILLGVETARTAFYSSAAAFASWTLKF